METFSCYWPFVRGIKFLRKAAPGSTGSFSARRRLAAPAVYPQGGPAPAESDILREKLNAESDILREKLAGNSPVTSQRPVTRSFDVFFDLRLDTRLSKQWSGW